MNSTIDLTPILQALIALLAALITTRLIPYIKSKTDEKQMSRLLMAANVAVYAAEQIYKTGTNEEKLDYAKTILLNQGFDVDIDLIRSAVEKAVYEMKQDKTVYNLVGSIEETAVSSDDNE